LSQKQAGLSIQVVDSRLILIMNVILKMILLLEQEGKEQK